MFKCKESSLDNHKHKNYDKVNMISLPRNKIRAQEQIKYQMEKTIKELVKLKDIII
jgi:hypothetical protein